MSDPYVVAIDGPAGSGKSSTARQIAARLGITHLDTGAMYRVVTFCALEQNIAADDHSGLKQLVDGLDIEFKGRAPAVTVWCNGRELTSQIRSSQVNEAVSLYCQPSVVRDKMVQLQRNVLNYGSLVAEGRDIATVVFADAAFKFFMVASAHQRAQRRVRELELAGENADYQSVLNNILKRDELDSQRQIAPLKKADDAIEIDTTNCTFEQQVDTILAIIADKGKTP